MVKTGWLYPLVLLLNGAFFGLFTIIPAAATKYGRNLAAKMLLFAAFWCLSVEWLRSFILTGFPWNPISSVLTFSPTMLQILSVLGTYGTSLILVLIAMLPAVWLVNPTKLRSISLPTALLALLGIWQFGEYTLDKRVYVPEGHSIIVRLVQPSIPQTLKWNKTVLEENLQKYVDLSREKDNSYISFTVWGETAYPYDLLYDEVHKRKLAAAVPPYGYLITGFLRRVDDGYNYTPYNSFGVINKQGELVGWYDKSHLVPFGEYIPLRQYLPEWVRPVANVVAEFGRGEKFKTLQVGNYPEFAPLICYEVIFSDEIIKKGDKRPAWAVVLTNDGWYGMSAGPYQHLAAAQMRAVEEGISIVRSANSGISAVIDPYGEIIARIPLGESGSKDALVKPEESHLTVFGKYGNRIALTMSGALIALAIVISLL
jgi:apolipoprotein N-acyltransferase